MRNPILYLAAFWAAAFFESGQAQNASFKEGEKLFGMSHYDSAIVFLEKAAQESASDKKALSKTLALKAASEIEMFRLAPAMKSAEEAVQAAKSASDKGLEARGLLLIGRSYFNQGNYTDGQKNYNAALALLGSTEKNKENLLTSAQAKEVLGVLFFNKYEYNNAMTLLKEALQEAEKAFGEGSPESLPFMLSLGDYYLGKGSHTLALDYYKKAVEEVRLAVEEDHAVGIVVPASPG